MAQWTIVDDGMDSMDSMAKQPETQWWCDVSDGENMMKTMWKSHPKLQTSSEVHELSLVLVGGLEPWNFMTFHFRYGMSSFPLTFTPSFFKMVKTHQPDIIINNH